MKLATVTFLDYRDSGMTGSPENKHPKALINASVEELGARIAHHIRRVKPQVILTFDPIGGYRHPDHIAVHYGTLRGFSLSASPAFNDPDGYLPHLSARLYYHVLPRNFLRWAVIIFRLLGKDPARFGKNKDIDLTSIAEVKFPVHAVVNYRPVQEDRDKASACHASQGGGRMGGGLFGPLRRFFTKPVDRFMQGFPEPENGRTSRDLFEGWPYNDDC